VSNAVSSWRTLLVLLVTAFAPGCSGGGDSGSPPPANGGSPPPVAASPAVAFQLDAGHTGRARFPVDPVFPDAPAWTITLQKHSSYPLIVDGRVFVVTPIGEQLYGVHLYALDARNGSILWGPMVVDGSYKRSNPAYSDGVVFVTNNGAELFAFDAATGAQRWSTLVHVESSTGTSAPTAFQGRVYLSHGHGFLHSVGAGTGHVNWSGSVRYGGNSSPAVTPAGVFAIYPCQYYRFDPNSGAQVWHIDLDCESGHGRTPAATSTRIFIRDPVFWPNGQIRAVADGSLLGLFVADVAPAIDETRLYTAFAGILTATDLDSQEEIWTFQPADGVALPPLVINGFVLAATLNGDVYALRSATGEIVWQANAGAPISSPNLKFMYAIPMPAMAVAEYLLVVPTEAGLTAWSLR
jgi:outer membrane protein assembly factor BamB